MVSPSELQEKEIYKFIGQVEVEKEFVVILEEDDGKIRCVWLQQGICDGTKYLKKGSVTEEVLVKVTKPTLLPAYAE